MSEEAAPGRIRVIWAPAARTDLRAIERKTAMETLHCLDRYLANRAGDVKQPSRRERVSPPLRDYRIVGKC